MSAEEKISKDRRGYCIFFQNQRCLSKSDIEKIFSLYGDVIHVGVSGDERGYRFVYYASKEEAEAAVEKASSHNIQLRFHKTKRYSCDNVHDAATRRAISIPVWQHEVDSADRLAMHFFDVEHLNKFVIADEDRDNVLNLMGGNNQPLEDNNRSVVRDAAEIIVGNVHPNYGGAYFLHLFEEYVPIGMSKIIEVPSTKMRYCHVYFRTEEDAKDIERKFDRHSLQDTKLIVMRPVTLKKACSVDN